MRVVQVNYAFDPKLRSAEALLDRYTTLTGWADALTRAGAEVLTVQQFHSSTNVTRGGVRYVFGPLRAIVRSASEWRPDVVHINGIEWPLRIRWMCRTSRTSDARRTPAIVVQDHGGIVPSGVRARVLRWALRFVDAFLFTAVDQAEPWRAAGLIRPQQQVYDVLEASTTLSPVAVDDAKSASGMSGDPALLWVGRLN